MLIVSQNGRAIFNMDKYLGIVIEDNTVVIVSETARLILGTYSADKVMQVKENLLGAYTGTTRNTIFYMPENY